VLEAGGASRGVA